ncbi:DNA processing protein [Promicromonospora umidemergens]|uniref:Smf/DprA SLOG domain-containing protein n=1 Tax=Promicromonospora umidemergens TaxID=629679 RepID=A0ABP8XE37_9MICO|nr:DNA-processing protein DprA [Promicromonospora umidemergens]MCP2282971.1 DNA processing protein [Promicromonospora umidemergens]
MGEALFELPRTGLRFDTGDPVLARAAWSRIAEPGDPVAGALVGNLGPVGALDWLVDAAGAPGQAGAALRRLGGGTLGAAPGLGSGAVPPGPADAPGRLPGPAVEGLAAEGQAAEGQAAGTPTSGARAAGLVVAAVRRWAPRLERLDPAGELTVLGRYGGTFLAPDDPRWPVGFARLGVGAPLALWVRGDPDLARLGERSVSLVGSRACTDYGIRVTRALACGLADRGFTVVSGGANGIDAEAHRGALVSGAPTVAFLAGGVDRLYPASNTDLLRRTIEQGAVVSEVPPGSVPAKQRFLKRNRLIASLTSGTVVVEASVRSGALSTANHAVALLRPLGAVPGPVTSMASAGCHELLRRGAAVCVTDAAEAAELVGVLGESAPERRGETRPGDDLDAAGKAVLDALPVRKAAHERSIARTAGLALGDTTGALGLLELMGLAEQKDGGWRRR